MPKRQRLFLIDGSSYIYRAYFAIRHLSNSKGVSCNAVLGFTKMLLKVMREHNPDQIAVIYDAKGATFRKDIYPAYKANRAKMPDDLVPQIPIIKQVVAGLNLASIERQGFEADDIIATIAHQKAAQGCDVTIVTGDKDLMQVVSEQVQLLDTMKDKKSGLAEVAERFGGTPDKVIEVQALAGDSADNVPGVPGIGEKTAKVLIAQFGTLENLLANIDQVKGKKCRENLRTFADQARLSHKLVTLITDMDIDLNAVDFTIQKPNATALAALFKELEFNQLYHEFAAPLVSNTCHGEYVCVTSEEQLLALVLQLQQAPYISLDTETTAIKPLEADLVGLSFSIAPGHGWYIPVGHIGAGAQEQLARELVLDTLRPILEDAQYPKVGQNLKYDALVLRRAGVQLAGIVADTMLMSYLLHPASRSHGLDSMAVEYLNHKMIAYSAVTGTGKKQINFAEVALDVATDYAAEDADITLQLFEQFKPQLNGALQTLFTTVELPLLQVLIDIEWNGIGIDCDKLNELSADFAAQIDVLQQKIYTLAGGEFNINSPKQLGEVLFDRIGLPHGKKTKTGWSTAVDVLNKLADQHEIVALVLAYRSLTKLKGTYTDSLPRLINADTGRIHTSFNQAVTATGRLSSSDPNLQNIPIRTAAGRSIRAAFIPAPGHLLLAADYSQIELRVMAHLADEPVLQQSFQSNEDIHTRTASEIFAVFPEMVTAEQRRRAKTVNFGVMYGMGAFSLAKDLGISSKEAKQYIDSYFARYAQVNDFIEACRQQARQNLYVTTLLGRHCAVPDINSKNGQMRSYAERNAVNYPVQGSAADIIKVAMIAVSRSLKNAALTAKMVLQVHDELVFDVPIAELEQVKLLVQTQMEQAVKLKVPIAVSMGWGNDWSAAH